MSNKNIGLGYYILFGILVLLASNNIMQFLTNIVDYNYKFILIVVGVLVLAINDTRIIQRLGGLK